MMKSHAIAFTIIGRLCGETDVLVESTHKGLVMQSSDVLFINAYGQSTSREPSAPFN